MLDLLTKTLCYASAMKVPKHLQAEAANVAPQDVEEWVDEQFRKELGDALGIQINVLKEHMGDMCAITPSRTKVLTPEDMKIYDQLVVKYQQER